MIGVLLIATGGSRYTKFVPDLVQSLKQFFPPHEVVLFTDSLEYESLGVRILGQEPLGWPLASLMRYKIFDAARYPVLEAYDHIFYMDIDMLVKAPIQESEICGDGITAVLHPGYIGVSEKTYDRNPNCTACLRGNREYYQGCFQGGSREAFFKMCQILKGNIDRDQERGTPAVWFDESYLNWYLFHNPPAITLPPVFAYPQNPGPYPSVLGQEPRIIHLAKEGQESWK